MKKLLQSLQLVLIVMAIMLTMGIVTAKPVEAAAASYQKVPFEGNNKAKVGDYWFKYSWEGNQSVISISKKKNSGYKKTPMSSSINVFK